MKISQNVLPRTAALGLCAALLTVGCQSAGTGTAVGTGAGALAGAGIGALTGDSSDGVDMRQRALIGAGIGALAGGAAGYYMDQQQQQLNNQLQGSGVQVARRQDVIYLTMPGDVTFRTDSSMIEPHFYGPLNQIAGTVREYNQTFVDVIGHTDSTGSVEYNQQLSEERAQAVAHYLIGQGVQAERIVIRGMSETQPIAPNDTAPGRAANRRVEVVLTPFT